MGRPKNTEKRELVTANACRLFIEQGYDGASYAAIAESSGISKNAVQSFFPKKEQLVVAFFERLEQYSETYLEEHGLLSENRFADLYLIGQLHFVFLTRNTLAKKFFYDVLSRRALTSSIVAFDNNFALAYLERDYATEHDRLYDDLVVSMGGMYELMYYYMSSGRPIDVPQTSRRLVLAYANSLGEQVEESMFERFTVAEADYDGINEYLMGKYFSDESGTGEGV